MWTRRHGLLAAGLAAALVLAGCGAETGRSDPAAATGDIGSGRKLRVVATTQMVADTVRRVGGDRMELTTLMGPGVDPHLYKASAGDVGRVAQADVVVYNGLHLEAKMAEVLAQLGAKAHAVGDTLPKDAIIDAQGAHDPHIWFDVALWAETVPGVAELLASRDHDAAAYFRNNADAYAAELRKLDEEVRARIASIPANARVLITAHDAFHYFGRAYGIEVRGLQGISTAAEAGTADVDNLAAFIAERRIPAIFVESSVPARSIEAVRGAVKARGFEVSLGGELFSDAMGNAGTPEGSYPGMVRHNVETIARALGAPEAAATEATATPATSESATTAPGTP